MLMLSNLIRKRTAGKAGKPSRYRLDLGDGPVSYPLYAIGDIHGCIKELQQAEELILADMKKYERPGLVVLLGDYIDRGPHSFEVIDHLVRPSELGLRRVALCGNHEQLLTEFMEDPGQSTGWLELGGDETLLSYGVDIRRTLHRGKERDNRLKELLAEAIPDTHRHFLVNLPSCLRAGQLVFAHAGIRPGVSMDDQRDEDLMWIREPFLSDGPGQDLLVIHGHTPSPTPSFGPGRIGIDTGAYYTGKLAVLKIDGDFSTFL